MMTARIVADLDRDGVWQKCSQLDALYVSFFSHMFRTDTLVVASISMPNWPG
jgi:hypothetical protein